MQCDKRESLLLQASERFLPRQKHLSYENAFHCTWPTASLKFGTLIPCNPSSSLGRLCTLKYPLILPDIHDTGCHTCSKHRPHSLRHFQAQTRNQQNHTWSTQTKHRGSRDRQLTAPRGANSRTDTASPRL